MIIMYQSREERLWRAAVQHIYGSIKLKEMDDTLWVITRYFLEDIFDQFPEINIRFVVLVPNQVKLRIILHINTHSFIKIRIDRLLPYFKMNFSF
jgi:hypothetical protein